MTEKEVFDLITERTKKIVLKKRKVVRVAINGIEGAGKTTFTKKLTEYLNQTTTKALHISIDGFHNKKKILPSTGSDL